MRTLQITTFWEEGEMRMVLASTKPFIATCQFCGTKADAEFSSDSQMYTTHTQYPCVNGKHRFEVSI